MERRQVDTTNSFSGLLPGLFRQSTHVHAVFPSLPLLNYLIRAPALLTSYPLPVTFSLFLPFSLFPTTFWQRVPDE